MPDFCKTFRSTTWIKPSVTTPKLNKFHSINYRRSISCSIFLFLGEHSPLTLLIFRSLAQRVRWAQGQCVRKKRFEISRWLMRGAPSLHTRLAGIGWNLYRWTKHRTRRMDKRLRAIFRVEVSNLCRIFLSRWTFILLLFCVFIMHTWLIITLRSRLHSVFTIVGRGKEEKIWYSLKRMTI